MPRTRLKSKGEELPSARARAAATADRARKLELGQFFTPRAVAEFMARLFPTESLDHVRVLDAGAGEGALSVAILRRLQSGEFGTPDISAVAYEVDDNILAQLRRNLSSFEDVRADIRGVDFILRGAHDLREGVTEGFSHAILNPPYKKISSSSMHRLALRAAGIETANLYSAFVAVALLSLKRGGHLCAIVPRSFCNGPYFKAFRRLMLREAALRRIHVFAARNRAFAGDSVLQENVIVLLERGGAQQDVEISISTDGSFSDLRSHRASFASIVRPNDLEGMIAIPSADAGALSCRFTSSLAELGITVSTGPVVDFRLRDHLRSAPGPDTVPLIYPSHFGDLGFRWPYGNPKKASAIESNEHTRKWFYPSGHYTVVRRLSSKEERKRIVANAVAPEQIPSEQIAFENHLNVFHRERAGLSREMALGLMAYLNGTEVDHHFRAFNGHTQVNATDLRALPYPDEATLTALGAWIGAQGPMSQQALDRHLARRT